MNSRHPSVIQPSERQITGHIVPRRGYLGVFSIALSCQEIGRKIFSTRHVVLQHTCNLYIFQHGSTVGQSIVGLRRFNSERIRLARYLRAVDISPCTGTQTDAALVLAAAVAHQIKVAQSGVSHRSCIEIVAVLSASIKQSQEASVW